MNEIIRWLRDEGWDILTVDLLEARRDRGDWVEVLIAAADGRVRYTLTRLVGDEEFRRATEGDQTYRVITRTYRETSVTAAIAGPVTVEALERLIRVARQ